MTNYEKLIRWDVAFYNSLDDSDCIVCLTEKQIYLIGQIIEQLTWSRTRWNGDTTGMDLHSIAEDLEDRLADGMTCETLTQLSNTINNLSIVVGQIERSLENFIDPAEDYDPAEDTISDTFPDTSDSAYTEEFTVSAATCDTAGKDATYGAAKALVEYIHAVNLDALQNISQLGNFSEQIERVISGTPLGLLPVDEVFGYATFIVEELLEEYEATVTEELLETVTCDLFCRFVANDCTIDIVDVANYMGQQVGSGFDAYANTFVDVLEFAATGTVSGDTIFYTFSLIQLVASVLGKHFFGYGGSEHYLIRAMTGLNNPDNDWSLLCDECPEFYRVWTWDFGYGMGDWTFEVAPVGSDCVGVSLGTLDGDRVKGVLCGTQFRTIGVILPSDPSHRIKAATVWTHRENGITNGTYDFSQFRMRVDAGTDTGSLAAFGGGFRPNGDDIRCGFDAISPFYWTGIEEIVVRAGVTRDDDPLSNIYVSKIEIVYEKDFARNGATLMQAFELCP